MFTLIRMLTVKQLVAEQLPALTLAFVIAELFYKLHSFTLECLAFLATWLLLDALITLGLRLAHAVGAAARPRFGQAPGPQRGNIDKPAAAPGTSISKTR
jgi:hypothetical protein